MRYCYEIEKEPRKRFITATLNGKTAAYAVEGWAVKLLDWPDHDFFIHRPFGSTVDWNVTVASTGQSLVRNEEDRHVAIREAIRRLKFYGIEEALHKKIDDLSPIIKAAYAAQSEEKQHDA